MLGHRCNILVCRWQVYVIRELRGQLIDPSIDNAVMVSEYFIVLRLLLLGKTFLLPGRSSVCLTKFVV
jgi:hypothetical protein